MESGEYCVILGRTGAGKSQLLEAVAGLLPLKKGRIFLDDEAIHSLPPHRRKIGFVFQDYALFPHLDVEANIRFSHRFGGEGDEALFAELLEFLEIGDLLKRRIARLSGGERQRVALARSLMARPRLLLLDEPLGAIDPSLRNSVMRSLKRLQRRYELTILHVTHNFREATYLADSIAIIQEGRLLRHGPADEVLRRPRTLEEAKFLGFKNLIDARWLGRSGGYASINPLAIRLADESPRCDHCFEGVIDEVLGSGEHLKIFVDTGEFRLFIKRPLHGLETRRLRSGERIRVGFDEAEILYFGKEAQDGT